MSSVWLLLEPRSGEAQHNSENSDGETDGIDDIAVIHFVEAVAREKTAGRDENEKKRVHFTSLDHFGEKSFEEIKKGSPA